MSAPRWFIDGHYILACNCDFGCPCNFQAPPTAGYCEGVIGFSVREGVYGDVRLDGLSAFLAVKWPGAIHHGGGAGHAYVDADATSGQREALGAIISGRVGGPWAMFASTLVTMEGPDARQIQAAVNGKDTSVSVDGRVAIRFRAIRNPVTEVEVFPRVALPQGLVYQDGEQYALEEFWVNDGPLSFAHPGKCGSLAAVRWDGP